MGPHHQKKDRNMANETDERTFCAWIDRENRVVSFQAAEGFEEMRFSSHEEMFAFMIEKSTSGYRIQ